MKKIYEDDFVIAVDTESENVANPIVVMYSTKVVRTTFDHCLDDFKHDTRFIEMVLAIICAGRNEGIYKNKIIDYKNFLEKLKLAIDDCSYDNEEDSEEIFSKYEEKLEMLDVYENWNLKTIKSIYLGG